ncbi:hypothetical protein SLIQ_05280 [Serratia liquefaciens FK01]|nr:hypothetical protein SLIQ_05280 [Serratia liquefaciens FK01]CAI2478976.1 lipoprotein [Serratia liquefaciens]
MRKACSPFFLAFSLRNADKLAGKNCVKIRAGRCGPSKQPGAKVILVNLSSLLRLVVVVAGVTALTGCGSIISRTVPGAGHGHQYYPGVQWDLRDSPWRYITVIDVPLSMVVDTFMLPFDAQHGPYE